MVEFIREWFTVNPATGLVEMSWLLVIILIIAGFLVGVINTIAGSGTVITYSLFMLLGLPAGVANGTIRFGVIMQTLAASSTFYKKGYLNTKKGLWLSLPVIAGTIVGAQVATQINQEAFEKVLGVVMLFMLFFIFYKPENWLKGQIDKISDKLSWKQWLLFLLIGIYGGFIHIGVGIFLLSALVLSAGFDLVRANALKVFIVFLYSPFALGVFIWHDQINLSYGLISAIGNVIGGLVASKLAINKGAGFIRWFLIIIMVLFSLRLLVT